MASAAAAAGEGAGEGAGGDAATMSSALSERLALSHGLQMPAVGLGTYEMSGRTCERAVISAIQAWYRLVDTASMYGNERQVGAAVARSGVPRGELFISSKLYPTAGYQQTLDACARTLEQLGTPYLDLYLVHWPGGGAKARADVWRAMEELLASGKVRSIGVSNYMQRHIQEILDEPSFRHCPHVNQCELHPFCQWKELRSFCKSHGCQFMGYMPFGAHRLLPLCIACSVSCVVGLAARHHTANHTTCQPHYMIGGEGAPLLRQKVVREAAAAASACNSREVSEAQLLVKFVRSVGAVAIPRSRDAAHQAQNADVGLGVQLPPELMLTLEALEANKHYDWDPTDVP
jgi:diketogulonate reductase-like aldo/keto reductase